MKVTPQPRCERCGAVMVFNTGLCAQCKTVAALPAVDQLMLAAEDVDAQLAAQGAHALSLTFGLQPSEYRAALVGASMVEWLADRANQAHALTDDQYEDIAGGSRLAVRVLATLIRQTEEGEPNAQDPTG